MSSPLAKAPGAQHALHRSMVRAHQALSHSHRIGVLADLLVLHLQTAFPGASTIRAVDVGCGDMALADAITHRDPRVQWTCLDVYPAPTTTDPRWARYRQFDGHTLPLETQSVDCVLLCDVLHHAGAETVPLLREAGRVARMTLVKDHFEYGWVSRRTLQAMDIVGNWGYGVPIPDRYFSVDRFTQTVAQAGMMETVRKIGISLYDHLPVVRRLLPARWHFIAQLTATRSGASRHTPR